MCSFYYFLAPVTPLSCTTRSGYLVGIMPGHLTLLEAAASPFSHLNGSRLLIHVLAVPITEWFNKTVSTWTESTASQTSLDLVLKGVPFGLVALLALDSECTKEFSTMDREWKLLFRRSRTCADALEVRFQHHKTATGTSVGIQMRYCHEKPGELTVAMMPARTSLYDCTLNLRTDRPQV